VKRTVILAAGVAALGFAIVATTQLAAQNTTPPRPAGTAPVASGTKIALLNLQYVIKNYKKFETFNNEMKGAVGPYQTKDTSYKTEGEKITKEAQDTKTTAERRDQIEKRMRELQRLIEDNKAEAQKVLGKKQEQQLYILYTDVHKVVQEYARAQSIDVIMTFNDPTGNEYWGVRNIARKMQADGLMPMFVSTNLDISGHILQLLNAPFGAAPGAAAPKR
jgi:Skp family chaperone for outer membrane proteins